MNNKNKILYEMLFQLKDNLLDKWYPLVIDEEFGGYFSNLSCSFELINSQEKMIVTQARNIWTLSKATEFFSNNDYQKYAMHGFEFLKKKMWDNKNGGFYQIRDRAGNFSEIEGWNNEKRVYGNAYGLFGLAALYKVTGNTDVLNFAKCIFDWIEKYSHDKIFKGYFQFLTEDLEVFDKKSVYKSIATDSSEVGYKDQNSSIHILEAFTEFYQIYNNELIQERLTEMLYLIRDTILHEKGYLQLFFETNWKPISFKYETKEIRDANYPLDHVSFGHDYETAFLMLEASYALKIKNDVDTLRASKKIVDHAIENGWDVISGGFYNEGYYFPDDEKCSIIKDTKIWWAQAEALNIYLLMSKIFPNEEKYYEIFIREWEYVTKYIIDHKNGDWYWGGLDKEPFYKTEPKGQIWKGTYHTSRALMNCITILSDENFELSKTRSGFIKKKQEMLNFIEYWKNISQWI